ncbi:hypothetical protein [Chitinimonas koreensis]|uniref:hypothetical protein n=1 Tax=Chitinimonas koreensis TaxID=356302 RepID=UPI0004281A6A|nr:hypothetical protein [Chitinimonas koreensis]QNM97614.1 hypothetical protein H9L41_04760 [Chitinimonas koreensis]
MIPALLAGAGVAFAEKVAQDVVEKGSEKIADALIDTATQAIRDNPVAKLANPGGFKIL